MTHLVHTNVLLAQRGPSLALPPVRGRRRLSTIMRQHAPANRRAVPLVFRARDAWQFADLDGLAPSVRRQVLDKASRMRADYASTSVGPRDTVVLVTLPLGGGGGGASGRSGKAAIGMSLAAIALFAVAGPAGAAIGGVLGTAVQVGLVVGGIALSMAAQKAAAAKKNTAKDPEVYSVSGGGNLPKPSDRRPLQYGRCWSTPPLSQKDYFLYDGTTTVLFKRLTLGIGKFQVHRVRVGEAIFWEAGAIQPPFSQIASSNPGLNPAIEFLYEQPSQISNGDFIGSPSVGGQELPRASELPSYTPWFRLTPQGVTAAKVLLAYSWPQLMNATSAKPLPAYGDVVFEAQRLDQATGNPYGPVIQIHRQTPHAYSRVVFHGVAIVDLPQDTAWQVRGTNAIPRTEDAVNDATWDEMAAIRPDLHIRPKTTEVVMRIRGGQGLNLTDYSDVRIEATRIVPVYDQATRSWIEQPTSKCVWAYADLVRAEYGLDDPDGLDLAKVLRYANRQDLAGVDTYDGQLPNVSSFWEAACEVLHPMRADPIKIGAIHSFVRDESAEEAGGRRVFSRRQIITDSGEDNFDLATDDAASGDIIVEFNRNGDPKTPDEVRQDKFPITRTPKRYRLAGIRDGAHALAHARYLAACGMFRGTTRRITAEWDGRLVYPGTHILSDLWFLRGKTVVGVAERRDNTLLLDADCRLPADDTTVSIRSRNGREWGLLRATLTGPRSLALNADDVRAQSMVARIDASGTVYTLGLDDVLARDTQDPTTIALGDVAELQETYIARSAVPSDDDHVDIEMVLDDPRVWQILGETVVAPQPPATDTNLVDPLQPVIAMVRARCWQIETGIEVVWGVTPARGAFSYEVELSYDAGTAWEPLYGGGTLTGGRAPMRQSNQPVTVRARAYGRTGLQGEWKQTTFTTVAPIVAGEVIVPGSVAIDKLVQPVVDILTGDGPGSIGEARTMVGTLRGDMTNGFVAEQTARQNADSVLTINLAGAVSRIGSAEAAISSETTTRASQTSALSGRADAFDASLGSLSATVTSVNQARIDGDNALSATLSQVSARADQGTASGQIAFIASAAPSGSYAAYSLVLKAGTSNVSTGFRMLAKNDGTSAVVFSASSFLFEDPNVAGGAPIPIITIVAGKVTFTSDVQINGALIQPGTVSGQHYYSPPSNQTLISGVQGDNDNWSMLPNSAWVYSTDVSANLDVAFNPAFLLQGFSGYPSTIKIAVFIDGVKRSQLMNYTSNGDTYIGSGINPNWNQGTSVYKTMAGPGLHQVDIRANYRAFAPAATFTVLAGTEYIYNVYKR